MADATHEVFNQPEPLVGYNLFETHRGLRDALRFMASFTHEKAHQFRWTVEADALLLEVDAPDLGTSDVRLTDGVSVSGPALLVWLN